MDELLEQFDILSDKHYMWYYFAGRVLYFLLASCIIFIFSLSIMFTLCPVSQRSMTPTIVDGQYVLLNKFDSEYERGEILVFNKNGTNMIKRLIALPGDTIEFSYYDENGSSRFVTENSGQGVSSMTGREIYVYVNGEQLDEPYVNGEMVKMPNVGGTTYSVYSGEHVIPEGCYFCMGDNRNESLDCRSKKDNSGNEFGLVMESELIGTLAYKIPIDSLQEKFLRVLYGESSVLEIFEN